MGAGKSLVGRTVARRSKRRFIDLDEVLVDRLGMPIVEVFDRHGEAVFRRAERDALVWAGRLGSAVVATGGGAFCDPGNRELIHREGRSVFLDVPWSVLAERLEDDHHHRPMFQSRRKAEELWRSRLDHYRQATWTLTLSGTESVDEVAQAVARLETEVPCVT
jgi:shikimate kinase